MGSNKKETHHRKECWNGTFSAKGQHARWKCIGLTPLEYVLVLYLKCLNTRQLFQIVSAALHMLHPWKNDCLLWFGNFFVSAYIYFKGFHQAAAHLHHVSSLIPLFFPHSENTPEDVPGLTSTSDEQVIPFGYVIFLGRNTLPFY